MTNILLDLELEELSLVDRPANQAATICLIKRDTTMSKSKSAAPEQTELPIEETVTKSDFDAVQSDLEAVKTANDRLTKALEEHGFVITEESIAKAEEPEYIEIEGEQVVKSDIPAPVLKALEDAAIEKAQVALRKQAEEILPNFNVDVAANILKAVAKDDAIVEALKSADAALGASMSEVGEASVDADMASPEDKLDSLVKSHMDENSLPKSSYAKAYAAVAKTDVGKGLIKELYKGE